MRDLIFHNGLVGVRKVTIKNRDLLFSQNGQIFELSLDKLDRIPQDMQDEKFIQEIAKLKTEDEIARDIIFDFQQDNWRLISDKHG